MQDDSPVIILDRSTIMPYMKPFMQESPLPVCETLEALFSAWQIKQVEPHEYTSVLWERANSIRTTHIYTDDLEKREYETELFICALHRCIVGLEPILNRVVLPILETYKGTIFRVDMTPQGLILRIESNIVFRPYADINLYEDYRARKQLGPILKP